MSCMIRTMDRQGANQKTVKQGETDEKVNFNSKSFNQPNR